MEGRIEKKGACVLNLTDWGFEDVKHVEFTSKHAENPSRKEGCFNYEEPEVRRNNKFWFTDTVKSKREFPPSRIVFFSAAKSTFRQARWYQHG